ncbi:MAG: DegV family protein [Acholeplasmataceae bacterium]|jgi:DegV family protein with EDD domain|nr:DegV family protein [Acholeplasmataceae bacterium]
MYDYSIIINSSTDLTEELKEELDLVLAPLKFTIEGKEYINYLDYNSLDVKEFYKLLRDGKIATTSQLNVSEYIDIIEKEFKKGKDVLILAFSSALSGTYNSARIAVEAFEDHKQKVYLVDTKAASLGEGLIAYLAGLKRKEGYTIEELYKYIEDIKLNVAHWFTVDDLMFLKRGGRVGGASAIIGSLLSIKPVLHVDIEGRLIPMAKVRGRKKALQSLVDKVSETHDSNLPKDVFISHGDDLEAALTIKEKIEALNLGLEVKLINYIGPVIGAHSGPGTIAVFFFATQR